MSSDSSGIREMIAKQYDRDLSGKNGALARFDAINELIDAKVNKGAIFSSADEISIIGANGFFSISGPTPRTTKKTSTPEKIYRPWDLVPVDEEGYQLYLPLIIKGREDVTEMVEVTNDPFTPEADNFLVLKIGSLPVTSATVELDLGWEGYPSVYEFETSDPWSFKTARIPIWRFFSEGQPTVGGRPGRIQFGEGVFGEKLVPEKALQVVYAIASVPGANRVRAVPDLI